MNSSDSKTTETTLTEALCIDTFVNPVLYGQILDRLFAMGVKHVDGYGKKDLLGKFSKWSRYIVTSDMTFYHHDEVRVRMSGESFRQVNGHEFVLSREALGGLSVATPAAPSTPLNPANFVVLTGGNPTLSRIVQELAFSTGILWTNGDNHVENESSPRLYLIRGEAPFPFEIKGIMHSSGPSLTPPADQWPIYSAATQMGEIVRLFSTPVVPPVPPPPTPPEIHGHKAVYLVGNAHVDFGCAHIDLGIIREARELMEKSRTGTRQVFGITLSSGKTLSREQVTKILGYVTAVEEYAKKYPKKSRD